MSSRRRNHAERSGVPDRPEKSGGDVLRACNTWLAGKGIESEQWLNDARRAERDQQRTIREIT